ncbi:hypothetical protein E2C01_025835 [Portunus trituberculatus]|uniref:Uncharacterized protein n=1 Tax=Portunus trituberculatus TaxID=210409 RepID=A0A5B7EEA8_PORTR|nr:hypothetical protein [Portunus trituberculatus]
MSPRIMLYKYKTGQSAASHITSMDMTTLRATQRSKDSYLAQILPQRFTSRHDTPHSSTTRPGHSMLGQ